VCGIAGIWGEPDEALVQTMISRLTHRGPDAEGLHSSVSGTLGHRRLSIMDPAGGNQPLHTSDGKHTLIANGEIYNHPALRKTLAQRHTYRTGSDSESALHLFTEQGPGGVAELDGMFALVIADEEALFLARDPVGIKPLYTGSMDGRMVFASELKALAGIAKSVRPFPPGTWYHSSVGFQRYYDLPPVNGGEEEEAEGRGVKNSVRWKNGGRPGERETAVAARAVREALEQAVGKRLMTDVPLGAFLSGGLDSSLVAALARRHVDRLHTFAVGFEGSPDLEAARLVARHLDTIHHEVLFDEADVAERLPEILFHLESFDPDLVRSAVPCDFVSRLASEEVKVVLTGEGADELFAGYRYYEDIAEPEELQAELRRSVGAMHELNLRRVDRMTMAHGLEGRVPFLDTEMIELALRLPAALKLPRGNGQAATEKWVLRKAAEGLLPEEVVWRKKVQFDEGSGMVPVLQAVTKAVLPPEAAAAHRDAHSDTGLRSDEECAYHKLLGDAFPDPGIVFDNAPRWIDGRGDA